MLKTSLFIWKRNSGLRRSLAHVCCRRKMMMMMRHEWGLDTFVYGGQRSLERGATSKSWLNISQISTTDHLLRDLSARLCPVRIVLLGKQSGVYHLLCRILGFNSNRDYFLCWKPFCKFVGGEKRPKPSWECLYLLISMIVKTECRHACYQGMKVKQSVDLFSLCNYK